MTEGLFYDYVAIKFEVAVLCLDFLPILKGKTHIVLAVDYHIIHQPAPEGGVHNGRFHSDWCSMMCSRLMLVRSLLTDDGVIFISIDDNEQENLKKMCNEVLGEENFLCQIAWRRTDNQPNIGNIARVKEYILCYAKKYLP